MGSVCIIKTLNIRCLPLGAFGEPLSSVYSENRCTQYRQWNLESKSAHPKACLPCFRTGELFSWLHCFYSGCLDPGSIQTPQFQCLSSEGQSCPMRNPAPSIPSSWVSSVCWRHSGSMDLGTKPGSHGCFHIKCDQWRRWELSFLEKGDKPRLGEVKTW